MRELLLFGGNGQLGAEVVSRAEGEWNLTIADLPDIDITSSEQVLELVSTIRPDLVVNAAAYTAVDKAEEDEAAAYSVNKDGAANIAAALKEQESGRLIHISTDYVFSGQGDRPYTEEDPTEPLGVYGSSKLAGDEEVLKILGNRALVVRTSSLHGRNGHNFVHTMIELFKSRDLVKVVSDQRMSPTWAGWLAEAVLELAEIDCSGIVHGCSGGEVSWYEFASEILNFVQDGIGRSGQVKLEPVMATEFPRPAPRPQYSVMDVSKLTSLLGHPPIGWKEGLHSHLGELGFLDKEESRQ